MSNWTPDPQSLQQLSQVLLDSSSPHESVRTQAKQALENARQQADLDIYLTFLLTNESSGADPQLRATAGLMLKNNIRTGYPNMPAAVQNYVKAMIIQGLTSKTTLVQSVTGNVITTLLSTANISAWPEILPQLISLVDMSRDESAKIGAMNTLGKICEDSASALDKEYDGQRPLHFIVPKLLEYGMSQQYPAQVKAKAIFCLAQTLSSQSTLSRIDDLLTLLFARANDQDSNTKRNVCTAFIQVLRLRPDKIVPHLDGVINYILFCVQDKDDEQLSTEACEFILALAESEKIPHDIVRPQLPKILPIILSTMVYSEVEKFYLQNQQEDDEDQADRAEDIKPQNAKSRTNHSAAKKEQTNGTGNANGGGSADDDSDDSDDDYDDEEGADELEWNVRKGSAASLDTFAITFPEEVLTVSMPILERNISDNDWAVREAAILAFGAVATGCQSLVSPHLPVLIPYLVERTHDKELAVRQISCWTIGRFSEWLAESADDQLFQSVVATLLNSMQDKNKKVQNSACAGFVVVTDQAKERVIPFVEPILVTVAKCFEKYKRINLTTLCDAVQTLTNNVGHVLAEPNYTNMLVPSILEKWFSLSDDDEETWSLIETLSVIAGIIGESYAPFAATTYERAVRIMHDNLIAKQNALHDTSLDTPENDFLITTLDLIDGLIHGLGDHSAELISQYNQQYPLVEMLLMCFQDSADDVRQSAFALLGDMVINVFSLVEPYSNQIVSEALVQIYPANKTGVFNNAMWAVGEICLKLESRMEPFVNELLPRLVTVMQAKSVPTVLENAAIAIGRLALAVPSQVAPHLNQFAELFCIHMVPVVESDEKDSAFQGMCTIICMNPQGLEAGSALQHVIQSLATYMEPSPELHDLIGKVFKGLQSMIPNWNENVMQALPADVAAMVQQRYNL